MLGQRGAKGTMCLSKKGLMHNLLGQKCAWCTMCLGKRVTEVHWAWWAEECPRYNVLGYSGAVPKAQCAQEEWGSASGTMCRRERVILEAQCAWVKALEAQFDRVQWGGG